jgi:hypothetical protein
MHPELFIGICIGLVVGLVSGGGLLGGSATRETREPEPESPISGETRLVPKQGLMKPATNSLGRNPRV